MKWLRLKSLTRTCVTITARTNSSFSLRRGGPTLKRRNPFTGWTARNRGLLAVSVLSVLLALCACTPSEYRIAAEPMVQATVIPEEAMMAYDFSIFPNVEISGIDLSTLTQEQLSVLYQGARYCEAMTEADIDTMREIVSEDMTFTHMSGMRQTREEYFADVADGSLCYYTIGMEKARRQGGRRQSDRDLHLRSQRQCLRRARHIPHERYASLRKARRCMDRGESIKTRCRKEIQ